MSAGLIKRSSFDMKRAHAGSDCETEEERDCADDQAVPKPKGRLLCRTQSLPPRPYQYKLFGDCVHGHVEFHPFILKIIDTPHFQRLRYLRQLGLTFFVFPGADHSRFEHSLGVCHLAGKLTRTLQQVEPDIGITDKDVLCEEIAGLCHDLGHGPFSHVFDAKFIPLARPGCTWTHEESSIKILDDLLKGLKHQFVDDIADIRMEEQDWIFIKELIDPPKGIFTPGVPWPCKGRGVEKSFLYQIVANKCSGIDVDKWDYFTRDAMKLGIKHNFDHNRLLKMVRVLKVDDDRLHICFRDKESEIIYEMFAMRTKLHRIAYQHAVGNCISQMVCEAMLEVDKVLEANLALPKEERDPYFEALFGPVSFSRSIDSVADYLTMTDGIFERILYSTHPKLLPGRRILEAIQKRQHWKTASEASIPMQASASLVDKLKNNSEELRAEIILALADVVGYGNSPLLLRPESLFLNVVTYNYGMGTTNPVDRVFFWNKRYPDKAFKATKEQISVMLPSVFLERKVVLYCKLRDAASVEQASHAFVRWCKKNGIDVLGGESIEDTMTPRKNRSAASEAAESSSKKQKSVAKTIFMQS